MKSIFHPDNKKLLSILLIFIILASCENQPSPERFQSGLISTANVEYGLTFSPDGNELFFTRSQDDWGSGQMRSGIYHSIRQDGYWSKPELVPFSGIYDDSDPHMTKDGKTLYFVSSRPHEDSVPVTADIWVAEKTGEGIWGIPQRLQEPLNSEATEYSPRTDGDGNLYFASDRPGGLGQGDLYVAMKNGNSFSAPVNLGAVVNTDKGEWNLEISEDGTILIFEASQRETNLSPYGDLYICFKNGEAWSEPQTLAELNTTGSDLYPELSEDMQQLYYTSSDSLTSKQTEIYYLEAEELIEKYRSKAVFNNK